MSLSNVSRGKQLKMRAHRPKKTVRFHLDTNFTPNRPVQNFGRSQPLYFPGKYTCVADSELDNTSFMNNLEYQLLHLKVHSVFRVRDTWQMTTLRHTLKAQENANEGLIPGSEIQLRDHEFRDRVLDKWYAKQMEPPDEDISAQNDVLDEWSKAKVLVIYESEKGEFMDFQLVNDTNEDLEADEYLRELSRALPAENKGIHRRETLHKLSDAWIAEVCRAAGFVSVERIAV